MANIDIKLGTIGPKHDPYATKTITFTATDGKVIEYYQDGLDSARISVNGKVVREGFIDSAADGDRFDYLFEALTGMTPYDAERIYETRIAPEIEDPLPVAWVI